MRKIVLDTETTGMHFGKPIFQNHYIIEIGAIALVDRKPRETFQRYIKAPRESSPEALAVHGITRDFLKNSPEFREVFSDLKDFIEGSELIIHNAVFDVSFLNAELDRMSALTKQESTTIEAMCPKITDTLKMARQQFPNRKNSLDMLCQRFNISNTHRTKHGALLDSELLLQVYLALTGGQRSFLFLNQTSEDNSELSNALSTNLNKSLSADHFEPQIAYASKEELARHQQCLKEIEPISSSKKTLWPQ